jgi:hypothetical protein
MQNTRAQISRLVLLALIALAALTACQGVIPGLASRPGLELTLVHSNDTWGYTDPCG